MNSDDIPSILFEIYTPAYLPREPTNGTQNVNCSIKILGCYREQVIPLVIKRDAYTIEYEPIVYNKTPPLPSPRSKGQGLHFLGNLRNIIRNPI